MPLVVQKLEAATVKRDTDGGYCPLLRCEQCNALIDGVDDGRAAWYPDENATYLAAVFLHRGCTEAYEESTLAGHAFTDLARFLDSFRRFGSAPEA